MRLIVGNQKTYLNKEEVLRFIEKVSEVNCSDTVICPSYPFINLFVEKTSFLVGAQNVSNRENGATTGEVSASQLSSLGCSYCIVGHSERRDNQKEDSNILFEKVRMLLKENISPIFCVGEHLNEKNDYSTKEVIGKEIMEVYNLLSKDEIKNIVIAYEPIWAIGTGLTPSNGDIEEVTRYIKDLVTDKYEVVPIVLYGGSVSKKNIDELDMVPNIDGYLIGGASTKADDFLYIMNKK